MTALLLPARAFPLILWSNKSGQEWPFFDGTATLISVLSSTPLGEMLQRRDPQTCLVKAACAAARPVYWVPAAGVEGLDLG